MERASKSALEKGSSEVEFFEHDGVLEEFSMSNQLSMAKRISIETLHLSGHSNREIARLLGIDRGTVNKYVARLASDNRPNSLTGSCLPSNSADVEHGEPSDSQNPPNALTGSSQPNTTLKLKPTLNYYQTPPGRF